MKSPNLLIILALCILLGGSLVYHVRELGQWNSELQSVKVELSQCRVELAGLNTTLAEEREKILAARELRHFSSLNELKAFLTEDNTSEHKHIPIFFDCDDFALMLQENALEEGYLINVQKLPVGGIEHLGNMAIVGNEIYYIEPEFDRVTYWGYLDRIIEEERGK